MRIATFNQSTHNHYNPHIDTELRIESETAGRLLGNGRPPRPTALPQCTFADFAALMREEAYAFLDDAGRLRYSQSEGRNVALVVCIELMKVSPY